MRGRLQAASRAGSITLLLGLLCAATLAAPQLASQPDFGHTHPHGTAPHLHPLELILGGIVSAPVVAVRLAGVVSYLRKVPGLRWLPLAVRTQHHSRAPPA